MRLFKCGTCDKEFERPDKVNNTKCECGAFTRRILSVCKICGEEKFIATQSSGNCLECSYEKRWQRNKEIDYKCKCGQITTRRSKTMVYCSKCGKKAYLQRKNCDECGVEFWGHYKAVKCKKHSMADRNKKIKNSCNKPREDEWVYPKCIDMLRDAQLKNAVLGIFFVNKLEAAKWATCDSYDELILKRREWAMDDYLENGAYDADGYTKMLKYLMKEDKK